MNIFGNLMSKIFGRGEEAHAAAPTATAAAATAAKVSATAAATSPPVVDVAAVLEAMAARNPQKLNWRTSIVDLMKLVGMDSSLTPRKQLARELGYTGNMEDSATMNLWLHQQVLRKLADNGGRVPADLLH